MQGLNRSPASDLRCLVGVDSHKRRLINALFRRVVANLAVKLDARFLDFTCLLFKIWGQSGNWPGDNSPAQGE
jgi:hypothetical protein